MLSTLLLSFAPALQEPTPQLHPVQHLMEVDVTPRNVRTLTRLDLDVAKMDLVASRAEVIVTDEEIPLLAASGLSYRLLHRDLAKYYAERLETSATQMPAGSTYGAWLSPSFGNGSMGGYYTRVEIGSVLDQMRATYPNLISAKQSLGTSIEGRPIWWVRISDNPDVDENEPEARFDSMHHSREPQGMQCNLWFMLFLLEEYGNDPLATYLVDHRELYFIPCVNPDGYEHNQSIAPGGGGLWRKNRRNNGGGSMGVDLNRNYPYEWGHDNSGSSTNPDSETYRGTSAESEPEVAAMVSFISGRDFNTALSIHTYSNLWLAPWGFEETYPANWSAYDEVGSLATEVNGYPNAPGSIILYAANGVTFDYDHGVHGTLAWTPEIGSSSDGFWPPQSRIVPLAEDNLLAFQRTALAAGPWIRPDSLTVIDTGDGDGQFEAGESVEILANLRNSGTENASVVDVTLTSSSPAVAITQANANGGPLASFTSGSNSQPLTMTILPGIPAGTVIPFQVEVQVGAWTQILPGEIFVGTLVEVASYDFEAGGNQGWSVGSPNDASTGEWTRNDPIGTAAQPEEDHTETGTTCWFTGQGSQGGSLGEADVDGGSTTLVSPVWDLSGGSHQRLSYARWYSNSAGADPNNDVLVVEVSEDGGANWLSAETIGPAGAGTSGNWFEVTLDLTTILTQFDQVRMRVIASDLSSGSIIEAALDDVVLSYIEPSSCATPVNYCTAIPNSSGNSASIGFLGSIDVNDANLTLTVSDAAAGQFGLFFYGPNQTQVPLGDGNRCVTGSLVRLPITSTDAFGGASTIVDLAGEGIQNGDTYNFQFWFRDPPGGPAGNNLSDGLNVTFCAD